ncbi:flagellar hook-length control protein FliK [Shewanella sp. Scap07]|uniref:flagellar hook-length control protein FliK n=1 Tax=Shewanella sp. Scap07 TaxID=2589987 RepID=UPI0015BD6DD1|nr:flagellar hook-length control protein FliK [Shewanella sp. Scap07]QLE86148.1 flagellar hook-length control protein FliK [Shewanella sp. Scap07]
MTQMNNILLAKSDTKSDVGSDSQSIKSNSLLSSDATGEATKQTKNNDFSFAMEQAAKGESKMPTRQTVTAVESKQPESTKAETDEVVVDNEQFNSDDSADIDLVLSQINLANAVAEESLPDDSGESLPLDDGEDLFVSQQVIDSGKQLQSDEELLTLVSMQTGMSKQELIALPPKDFLQLVSQIGTEDKPIIQATELTNLVQNATEPQAKSNLTVEEQQKLHAAQLLAVEELKRQGHAADKSTLAADVDPKTKSDASVLAQATGLASEKNVDAKVLDKHAVSQVNQSAVGVEKTAAAGGSSTAPSASIKNILGEDTSKGVTASNSATSSSDDVSIKKVAALSNSNVSSGELQAAMQLKDAKLAVSLNANGSLDNSAIAEAKDTTSTHSISAEQKANPLFTATQQINRNEVAQIQVSIRSQHEGAQQMQDMIQKFSPVMRQQLVTMVSQGIQHAEIRLDPPELGQMMVRIQVQGDQTQVQFQVAQHQTRDIVEQALPRLREMLAEQGMQLTDSDVSQQQQGEEGADGEQGQNGLLGNEMDENTAEETLLAANQATTYQSGIDYYA